MLELNITKNTNSHHQGHRREGQRQLGSELEDVH